MHTYWMYTALPHPPPTFACKPCIIIYFDTGASRGSRFSVSELQIKFTPETTASSAGEQKNPSRSSLPHSFTRARGRTRIYAESKGMRIEIK